MSYDAARKTIQALLDDNWDTTKKVMSMNELPPESGNWVRLNISSAESFRAAVKQKFYRHPGLVVVQVFVEKDKGNGLAVQYGDSIASIFRGATGGGILFRAATVREIGPTEGWYQVNVEIPFLMVQLTLVKRGRQSALQANHYRVLHAPQ